MTFVAIIQARMGSKRLPGKVMFDIFGKPVIEHIVDRLRTCITLKNIVVATSTLPQDDIIVNWCVKNGVDYYRGSLSDVLGRYYKAAIQFDVQNIVRITADCPLIDPLIVDETVNGFKLKNYDSYSLAGSFPDGLDVQVFSFDAIKKSHEQATSSFDREHVGNFIERTRPDLFVNGEFHKFKNCGHYRWTLDLPNDFVYIKKIYEHLYSKGKIFHYFDIMNLINDFPEFQKNNHNIINK